MDKTCPYENTITMARDTIKPACSLFFKIRLNPCHKKKARIPTMKISVKISVKPRNNTKSILKAKRDKSGNIANKIG